jgi:alpha-glucosidase
LFGTLADFDRLLAEAHVRDLKVILDFVPNHSSAQHPWFMESRSSRDNPKRNWYIWRDPGAGGGPPNNWLSCFGGSAWEYDPHTRQYYYHAFLREQPDLNWRNPEVVEAMLNVLRFWLERGVDGFRVDVLWHLMKDEQFRDNPPNASWREGIDPYQKLIPLYTTDQVDVHAVITRMRHLVDQYQDRVLIGEIYLPIERLVQYYGVDLGGVHVPFNFSFFSRSGTRARSLLSSGNTKRRCRRVAGRTGFSETTTGHASHRGSVWHRRAWRRCCSSPCAARRRFIMAMRSACVT